VTDEPAMSQTGRRLTIDARSPVPPFEQIRAQISALVGSGDLRAGDRLPPVRQLAADLGLAIGTVNRAYRELEAEGLVVTRRRTGTHIAEHAQPTGEAERRRLLEDAAAAYVRTARALGADAEAITAAVSASLGSVRVADPG
jgi:GntR family transcriptional regulator